MAVGRVWTFELYPDSMSPNYRTQLDNLHIEWVESPVHDRDFTELGKPKKPHIHIVLRFEGNKSYDQIVDIANSVNGVIPPEKDARVNSIRGMIRYLIHKDNPDKAQYERSAIICHGGIDINEYFQYAGEMVKRFIQEMIAFCDANCIFEYSDLLEYAADEKYDTWYDLLTIGRQSFVITKYLDSKRNKAKKLQES